MDTEEVTNEARVGAAPGATCRQPTPTSPSNQRTFRLVRPKAALIVRATKPRHEGSSTTARPEAEMRPVVLGGTRRASQVQVGGLIPKRLGVVQETTPCVHQTRARTCGPSVFRLNVLLLVRARVPPSILLGA